MRGPSSPVKRECLFHATKDLNTISSKNSVFLTCKRESCIFFCEKKLFLSYCEFIKEKVCREYLENPKQFENLVIVMEEIAGLVCRSCGIKAVKVYKVHMCLAAHVQYGNG